MVLKNIAVTGASGMLGRHIVAALEFADFNVITCSRPSSSLQIENCWDLRDWRAEKEFDELFKSVDAIIHAGAAVPNGKDVSNDGWLFDVNVRASFNVAHWARKRRLPLIYISGAIVYADPGREKIGEASRLGENGLGGFYGLTKLLTEDLLGREKAAGLKLTILRPSSIYGYGLGTKKMLCSFLNHAQSGHVIELSEPVEDSVDLVHAADVANAVVRVLKSSKWGIYNLSSGCNTTVNDLAKMCVSVVGQGAIKIKASNKITRSPVSRFALNCALAKQDLGWSAHVSLSTGLRALYDNEIVVVRQK